MIYRGLDEGCVVFVGMKTTVFGYKQQSINQLNIYLGFVLFVCLKLSVQ